MLDPLIWLVASVAMVALAGNLLWLGGPGPGERGAPSPRVAALARPALFLLIPAAAVSMRVLTLADLGIPTPGTNGADGGAWPWPRALLAALGLALVAGLVVTGGRLWRAQAWGQPLRPSRRTLSWAELATMAEQGAVHEVHWAFYRACLLVSGFSERGLAVFLSLLVLGLEAWSWPSVRLGWTDPDRSERSSQTSVLAILSAQAFLLTGSSVWALAAQLGCALGLAAAGLYLPRERGEDVRDGGDMARPGAPAEIEPTIV